MFYFSSGMKAKATSAKLSAQVSVPRIETVAHKILIEQVEEFFMTSFTFLHTFYYQTGPFVTGILELPRCRDTQYNLQLVAKLCPYK